MSVEKKAGKLESRKRRLESEMKIWKNKSVKTKKEIMQYISTKRKEKLGKI